MRFIIFGGGCYGTFYTRQLLRAFEADAISEPDIVVVDHSEAPQVGRQFTADTRVRLVRAEWATFLQEYLHTLDAGADDQIVPPPFTPHLALAWLHHSLEQDRPDLRWSFEPFSVLPTTPFVNHSENGTLTASHADWLCPVHCIEPAQCPKTGGRRDWDMAHTARQLAERLGQNGQSVQQIHLFQCLHFTHGVGTYPASALKHALAELRSAPAKDGAVRALVGTVSRCHGALHLLNGVLGTDTVSPPGSIVAAHGSPWTHVDD